MHGKRASLKTTKIGSQHASSLRFAVPHKRVAPVRAGRVFVVVALEARERRAPSRQTTMAAELKEGRELYKSGKFGDAAAKFGLALEDDSTEVDQLHMIHSNRCACYMQLKAFDKAYDAYHYWRPFNTVAGLEILQSVVAGSTSVED